MKIDLTESLGLTHILFTECDSVVAAVVVIAATDKRFNESNCTLLFCWMDVNDLFYAKQARYL